MLWAKKKNIIFQSALCLAGGIIPDPCHAGAQVSDRPDFVTAVHMQVQSATANAAFLPSYTLPEKWSYLQYTASKKNGGFRNYNQSNDSFDWQLETESYFRLSPRLSFYGAMDYSVFTGRNMEGSAFWGTDLPFDIVESDQTNAGRKRNETYHFKGSIGWQAAPRLSFGASADYTAANYAKYKDLRHKNMLMHLHVDAGMAWAVSRYSTLGLSYRYGRRNQAVEFNTYGNKDIQYYSLISYGSFFGRQEAFGETGYTSQRTPLFEQEHGGAVQFYYHPTPDFQILGEGYAGKFSGRFGKGTSTSVTYTHHHGNELGFKASARWNRQQHVQILDIQLAQRKLRNFENSFNISTDESNVTQIIYYGSNEVMHRTEWDAMMRYTLFLGMHRARPRWTIEAETGCRQRQSKTTVYPFYRNQTIRQYALRIHLRRNLPGCNGLFRLSGGTGYAFGGGMMNDDGRYGDVSSGGDLPFSRDDLLQMEYDYYTAPRVPISGELRYETDLKNGLGLYAEAVAGYTLAWHTLQAGNSRTDFTLRVGCRF